MPQAESPINRKTIKYKIYLSVAIISVFIMVQGELTINVSEFSPSIPYSTNQLSKYSYSSYYLEYPTIIDRSMNYLLNSISENNQQDGIVITHTSQGTVVLDQSLNESMLVQYNKISYCLNGTFMSVQLTSWNGYNNTITNLSNNPVGNISVNSINQTVAALVLLTYPGMFTLEIFIGQDVSTPPPGGGGGNTGIYVVESHAIDTGYLNVEWQLWLNVTELYNRTTGAVISGSENSTTEEPYENPYWAAIFYDMNYVIDDATGFYETGLYYHFQNMAIVGGAAAEWGFNYMNYSYENQNTQLTLHATFNYINSQYKIVYSEILEVSVNIPLYG